METKQKIKCVHCGKNNFIKKGFRKTENRGKIQVYKCLECNRKFTNDEGFYRTGCVTITNSLIYLSTRNTNIYIVPRL